MGTQMNNSPRYSYLLLLYRPGSLTTSGVGCIDYIKHGQTTNETKHGNMSTKIKKQEKAICNTTVIIRHEMPQVAEKHGRCWPDVGPTGPTSAQHRPKIIRHLGPAISTIKKGYWKTYLWLLYSNLYIKFKPKLVRYRNNLTSLPTSYLI